MSSDERAIRVLTWMWRAFKWWAPQTFVKADSAAKSDALGQAMQVLLRNLAEHCNTDANNDRVSVYYFHDDRFVMLSRYSLHPDYKRAARKDYPTNQGAIGEAWLVGSAVLTLPTTRAKWEQRLVSKYGYSKEEAKALRMHSTSIAARRVEVGHNAVGVIVFESTDEDTVTQQTLYFVDESKIYAALAEMISSAAMHTPRGVQLSQPVTPSETRSGGDWKPAKRWPSSARRPRSPRGQVFGYSRRVLRIRGLAWFGTAVPRPGRPVQRVADVSPPFAHRRERRSLAMRA